MTILDVAEAYVSSRVLSGQYRQQLLRTAKRLQACVGPISVQELGPQHAVALLNWLNTCTGNPNTKANHVLHIKILLRYALACGLIKQVPPLPLVKRAKRVPRAWTLEEFQRLYAAANQLPGRVGVQLARIWWPSLIAAAYHTASRIGALLSVRWSDLDLSRSILILKAENTKTKREQIFQMPAYVIAKIKAMEWPQREFVWEWPHTRRWFFRNFRKILRMVDLEPPPNARFSLFHQIRRTSATVAAQHLGIQAAQTLLGHTSARITIEHYIDPSLAGRSVILPSLE